MIKRFIGMRLQLFALCFSTGVLCAQGVDPALKTILDRHAETRGGLLKLNALDALHIEGATSQQGRDYRFVIFKKKPGLIRLSLEGEGETLLLGFDGRIAWKRLTVDGKARTETLDAGEARVLRQEASLDSPLINYLEKPENRLSYVGVRRVSDVELHVIDVRLPSGEHFRYCLDRVSLDLYEKELLDPDGKPLLRTRYRDYRDVGGYRFAFMIENFIGDKLFSLTEINEIKVNPGLLSFYFKPPL